MTTTISLAELATMSPADRARALDELVTEARGPRNGNFADVEAEIRALEVRYELNSAQLLEGLEKGTERETAEIAHWLFLLTITGGHGPG